MANDNVRAGVEGGMRRAGAAARAIGALVAIACFMDVPAALCGERALDAAGAGMAAAADEDTALRGTEDPGAETGEPGQTVACDPEAATETIVKSASPLGGPAAAATVAGTFESLRKAPSTGASLEADVLDLSAYIRGRLAALFGMHRAAPDAGPGVPVEEPAPEGAYAPAYGYEEPAGDAPEDGPAWVEDSPAWDEVIEVSPAWDEQVWVEDAPAWEEQAWVEDAPAWDEQTVETWTVFYYDGYSSQSTSDILAHAEELALQHLTASYYDEYIYGSVHHEAEGHWETIVHEASGHWEAALHDAQGHWETMRHDPETAVVHHDAQGHWE